MAIFKPKTTSTTTSEPVNYLGVIDVGILGFTDRSGDFDWADVFIEIELSVKNSEYSNKMAILGRLDKDSNDTITGGSVLNRLYKMFDAIECNAGLNIKGTWEDEHGNKIKDIAEYLNERYTTKGEKYHVYAYKKKPKPGKKVFTEIYPKFYPLTVLGKIKCSEEAVWLKEKGIIKEADASDMPKQTDIPLANEALNNL
jgi:hypothetical protein